MKNIGQTSQLTGLSQRMLRYFEDQGLLKPSRSTAGSRLFSTQDITEILRIRKLHELGFTYPEIKILLSADEQELAKKGTTLLEKHHEAAVDLQEKIQNLEMICFGEKRSSPSKGVRTLDQPHRTAYPLKGASEASSRFQELTSLRESNLCYWKFSWFSEYLAAPLGEFTLYEILDGSSLMAIFRGKDSMQEYEASWKQGARLSLNARELGTFARDDLDQFFSAQEIVIEHTLLDGKGAIAFMALLPYAAFFSALGKADKNLVEEKNESPLSFRPIDSDSLEDFSLIAKWSADSTIRHLCLPHMDETSLVKLQTPEEIRGQYKKGGPFAPVEHLMILSDGYPIGHCSLIIDPPHRITRDRKVGWVGITIGEEKLRAKGLGKKIADHLEALASKHGAEIMEVGIFEFNEVAKKLCLSMGYEEIGRLEKCTYWQGRHWADLRFTKKIG